MSRVLLLSTNTCRAPYPVYPLGMAVVAAALLDAGHQVLQFDWLAAGRDGECLRQELVAFGPDVVAVSIRNIDQIDSLAEFEEAWELREARTVVALVRETTDAPVVIGGPAVSMMPSEVRQYVGADVAAPGEGERSVADVVQAVAQGQPLSAVWPRASTGPDVGLQSSPAYDESLVSFYNDASGIIGVQSKRGCPYRCCYCTYPEIEGRHFRPRSIDAVLGDMERLRRNHQVDNVFFADSVFNDPQNRYLELAEALASRALGMRWAAYFSPKGLTSEAVALCKRAGLYAVELGTDASSDVTLAGMGKPFVWSEVEQANRLLAQARVACAHFVIFGGPDETPATLREGLDNIEALQQCVVFGSSGIRVYPGAPLHERSLAEGVVNPDDRLLEPVYYVSPALEKRWLDEQLTQAWSGRQDRIFPPNRALRYAARLRDLGWKGLLWDRMICFASD